MNTVFINGRIIYPSYVSGTNEILVFNENKIVYCGNKENYPNTNVDNCIVDLKGKYVSPGFIDIHCHGGGNFDFMDCTEEEAKMILNTHLKNGTTSMIPTTLSSTWDELDKSLTTISEIKNIYKDLVRGIHIEGPYLNKKQKGAQNEELLCIPDKKCYCKIIEKYPLINRWTIAPELPGALELGRYLVSKKISPSIGHSDADFFEVQIAKKSGFKQITHLYSGMGGPKIKSNSRVGGIVEAAFLDSELKVELIGDMVHVPAHLVSLVYKVKGADNIAFITDAMRASGTNEKISMLGSLKNGIEVIIDNNVAILKNRKAFAGSIVTMKKILKNIINNCPEIPLFDVIKMLSLTPATMIKQESMIGSIKEGKIPNLLILDNSLNIETIYLKGRKAY